MVFPVEITLLFKHLAIPVLIVVILITSVGVMIIERAQARVPVCIAEMKNLSNSKPCGCWRSSNWTHADCPDGGGAFANIIMLTGHSLGNCSTVELLSDNETLGGMICS